MIGLLRWEDPPPTTAGRGRRGLHNPSHDLWLPVVKELIALPGEWAVVFEGEPAQASGLTSSIKKGILPAFQPAGAFDAVSRKRGDVGILYARYIGEPS